MKNIDPCPILRPNIEEFADPIGYLARKDVLELGTKYGLVKLVPPAEWKPPFSISPSFRFHTRLQRLGDLGIIGRSRSFFHDNLNRFLKMKKQRGLRRLCFRVQRMQPKRKRRGREQEKIKEEMEGEREDKKQEKREDEKEKKDENDVKEEESGSLKQENVPDLQKVSENVKVDDFSANVKENTPALENTPGNDTLRGLQDTPLLKEKDGPMEGFNCPSMTSSQSPSSQQSIPVDSQDSHISEVSSKSHLSEAPEPTKSQSPNDESPSKSYSPETSSHIEALSSSPVEIYYYDLYKEVDSLKPMDSNKWAELAARLGVAVKPLKWEYDTHIAEYANYLDSYGQYDFPDSDREDELQDSCVVCGTNDEPSRTLLCDNCDNAYHMDCLRDPIDAVPAGKWYCDKCLVGTGEYGFEERKDIKYTPQEFLGMCQQFEADYMAQHPGVEPSVDFIEREFWGMIERQDPEIEVKYGADIHNLRPGEISGFPMNDTSNNAYYVEHPFNLTKLPFAHGSLLNYIHTLISGMTVPWIYIGSLFSTFCWHVEDHYTLSANYCHVGATKKWYGIPLRYADAFEALMKSKAPDLFRRQPDLLHQLVTLLSPETLTSHGIECYYADQEPGEYVITYPRVYHSGFNCGFNFNEAVNFTMGNWLSFGKSSIDTYKHIAKENVFDHYVLLENILNARLRGEATEFSNEDIHTCWSQLDEFTRKQRRLLESVPFPRCGEKRSEDENIQNVGLEKSADVEKNANQVADAADDDDELLCELCKTYLSHQYCEIDNSSHKLPSMVGTAKVQRPDKISISQLLTPEASPYELAAKAVPQLTLDTQAAQKLAELQGNVEDLNGTSVGEELQNTSSFSEDHALVCVASDFEELVRNAKKRALDEQATESSRRRTSKRLKNVQPSRFKEKEIPGAIRLLNDQDVVKLCLECVQKHGIYGDNVVVRCTKTLEEMQEFLERTRGTWCGV